MNRTERSTLWSYFSEKECRGYSPLYEQITLAVSKNEEVLDFLINTPSDGAHPNLLLAAVHDRVLQGLEPELYEIYYQNGNSDVGDAFIKCVLQSQNELAPVLTTRYVQTNEIGRVASLIPALATLQLAENATLVDVGCSAGLTLTRDHCFVDYGAHGTYGPLHAEVRIQCDVLHGNPPLAQTRIADQIGFDRNPIDVRHPDDYRWMQACVWPDTGRTERTKAALNLAADANTKFVKGDAITDLPALLSSIAGPLVITTTWALVYLPREMWTVFSQNLAEASHSRPVYWISAEAAGVAVDLPSKELPDVEGPPGTVLGSITYENGKLSNAKVLAHVHSHGKWMWWYD